MHFSQKTLAENHARLIKRNAVYRRSGYDMDKSIRFVLSHALPLKGRVLEIGTGKGRFLVALAKRANRVVTVDLDAAEQRFGRLNAVHSGLSHNIRFVTADAADLPFAAASFDAVVSLNALHHIWNLEGVLDEILRVVTPGGKIVLADVDSTGFRIFERIHRQEGRTHERFPYKWPRIIARLRKAGFHVHHLHDEKTVLAVCVPILPSRKRRN